MKYLLLTIILILPMNGITLFNFNEDSNFIDWKVIEDVFMVERSTGSFFVNESGHDVFEGTVSLENNGGFSYISLTNFFKIPIDRPKISIKLKGDGKNYQLRLNPNSNSRESYVHDFYTTGSWHVIEIPLKDMYLSFCGRRLNKGNFNSIAEKGFRISTNKKTRTLDWNLISWN